MARSRSTPSPRLGLAAVALAVALVGAGCSGSERAAGPPTSAPPPLVYVSLGDSYSAGGGLPRPDGPCGRTPGAYPALVAARARLDASFRACNGATTDHVLEREARPGERPQIEAVGSHVDVVTISIGGNDIGFGPVMSDCVIGPRSCARLEETVAANLAILRPRLETLYRAVRARAPEADLLVVGYPHLVADPAVSGAATCAGLAPDEVLWVRRQGEALARVVQAAATAAGARYLDAAAAFAGHEACTGEPWMEGVNLSVTSASFHPNAAGHERLARLVEAALPR